MAKEQRKVAKQADTESLESQVAQALGLTLNETDRFGPDAKAPNGNLIEIKSLNLDSASPAVQFAHNKYPDKYNSFLEQHCIVVLHRNSIAESFWLLRKGKSGFWTQWIEKCKEIHGEEDKIIRRMIKLYKEKYPNMSDFEKKLVERTIPGAVLTKKQWSFSIDYLYKYGEKITKWPSDNVLNSTHPPKCNLSDHPNMFKTK